MGDTIVTSRNDLIKKNGETLSSGSTVGRGTPKSLVVSQGVFLSSSRSFLMSSRKERITEDGIES